MSEEKLKILVDNRERKSVLPLDDVFDITLTTLPVGDVAYGHYLIELKVGKDLESSEDWERLEDELTRMSQRNTEYPHLELHAIVCDTVSTDFNQHRVWGMRDYKRFVTLCCRAGVFPHHSIDLNHMILKVREIFLGAYAFVPKIKHSGKNLSLFAKMISQINGVSEWKAQALSEELQLGAEELPIIDHHFVDACDRVFTTRKGYSQKALIGKILRIWGGRK